MKKIILYLATLVVAFPLFSQNQQSVSTRIESATVFYNGAQVVRKGQASLKEGTTELVFKGISPNINPASIQLKGEGQFTILSVQHQINYLEESRKDEEITRLENKKEKLTDTIAVRRALYSVLKQEESFLQKNQVQVVGVPNNSGTVEQLKAGIEYQRERLKDVLLKELEIEKAINELSQDLSKINAQLGELNTKKVTPSSEVYVSVNAKSPLQASFELSYMVLSAFWKPFYDLRVADVSHPMELTWKAQVSQQSGEDWKDVHLTLSTGNPSEGGEKPTLTPWLLYAYRPYAAGAALEEVVVKGSRSDNTTMYNDGVRDDELKAIPMAPPVQEQTRTTTSAYVIDIPYSIPSSGKQYNVEIKNTTLNALYEYFCAPKLDKDAFLTAKIPDWEDYNLLPGQMNLYFEGTYLGNSMLNPASISDTLVLSLGRDKSVVVERTRVKDFSKKVFLSDKKIEMRGWDITVKNKKKQLINLVIEDQLPISTNKAIEVYDTEYKGAQLDETTGKLTWKMQIDPGKDKKTGFRYSIKFPKSLQLNLE